MGQGLDSFVNTYISLSFTRMPVLDLNQRSKESEKMLIRTMALRRLPPSTEAEMEVSTSVWWAGSPHTHDALPVHTSPGPLVLKAGESWVVAATVELGGLSGVKGKRKLCGHQSGTE